MRAVVIGSGVGGLVSANLLAAHGWDVTVLEQHYRAGGYLHRFFRHGAGFDTGFHYVGSARPDQLFGRVLRHAGVYDRIQLDPLDPDGFDELRLPGMTLRVPAGADRWRDRLIEAFPHQRDPLHAFFAALEEAVRSYGLYRLDDSVRPEAILPWEELSLLGMFERVGISDARLRTVLVAQAFLYGVPPRDAPFGLHAIVHDHFADGGWTIRGGGDRLALALVRELRSRGGRIEFRARVQRIDVEAGNATRVHTADGRSFPVDLVVANTHPAAVAEMVPAGTFRRAYVERVSTTEPGVAHVAVYLRVRGDLTEVARRNLYRLRTWDVGALERSATPESVPYYFLTAPGARDGRGEGVVLALCAASWEDWKVHDGVQPRPESYRAAKAAIAGALVRAIAEDFPGWEIDVVEASTPVSTRAYTLARAGAIYGHYHSVSQMGRYRLPIRTKVQNLLHVGQSVGFPGVCGASMTAYLALSEVPGLEGIVEELKRA